MSRSLRETRGDSQRKFAYDLWGDTVNLASRLESHGQPGRILVSERVVGQLEARNEFGPHLLVDLKGKGPNGDTVPALPKAARQV
jgi:class 3 adenylate cyclase